MIGAPRLPAVGEQAELAVDVTAELVDRFADLCGDHNPLHMDESYARAAGFPGRVAHGMSFGSFVSTLIGTHLPGPGALWASQSYRFLAPVIVGDRVRITARVVESSPTARSLRLSLWADNRSGKRVMEGESHILVPGANDSPRPTAAKVAKTGDLPIAVVAGGGGALGSAIAGALARANYAVVLGGRNEDRLRQAAARIDTTRGLVLIMPMDLTNGDSVDTAIDRTVEELGTPALVVHAASDALPCAGPIETGIETYRRHFETQVGGLHSLARRVVPAMVANGGGQFIYIGSTATHGPPPRQLAAYVAAKSAAASLARSIAQELAPRGIRANIVSPHFLATELTGHVTEKARKLVAAQTPLRRLADLDEVAGTVVFLAGAQGAFVNGHDLVVDGGASMA